MIKFIERLFIKKRMKQFAFMNRHCSDNARYAIIDLWTGKFYYTIQELEYLDYAEAWDCGRVKYVMRDCLIMIK